MHDPLDRPAFSEIQSYLGDRKSASLSSEPGVYVDFGIAAEGLFPSQRRKSVFPSITERGNESTEDETVVSQPERHHSSDPAVDNTSLRDGLDSDFSSVQTDSITSSTNQVVQTPRDEQVHSELDAISPSIELSTDETHHIQESFV